ncbi:flagellar hook-basal body protein [Aquibacillus koreensis]|uniref:Flagellar hook-basal body protein n=1 Tax=Aquibacillus koreensis TaxID=279446 RepID=A0A9X3WHC2_9BACI|nr:flagellar hook-basal body protein [Aquibacillus koreensis]MCT2535107.1 flagellar hook-basal body protein [Aquibacillus koreensis]MDC3419750.1 flagellar hook-basal body protein [Aquibacillus koreensis]
MLRGYYTATAGMIAQQRRQETLSNNLTNALTPGYKRDQATLKSFPELLIQRMESNTMPTSQGRRIPQSTTIGSINTGVYVQETIPDFTQGALRATGTTTDMAIVNGTMPDETGNVLFTVQNGDGDVRYTRNGNFTVDGQGYLTSNEGYYVLNQDGNPILTDGQEFNVTPEGNVELAGQAIPLGLAYSPDANQLIKEGEGLYQLAEDQEALTDVRDNADVTYSIQQGSLEDSNVDMNQTVTEMMQAYRNFETNQKVLQAYDRSMEKAVNEIGRVT